MSHRVGRVLPRPHLDSTLKPNVDGAPDMPLDRAQCTLQLPAGAQFETACQLRLVYTTTTTIYIGGHGTGGSGEGGGGGRKHPFAFCRRPGFSGTTHQHQAFLCCGTACAGIRRATLETAKHTAHARENHTLRTIHTHCAPRPGFLSWYSTQNWLHGHHS